MNLKWKPTKMSLELARRLFGPDRAEVTKRSNNVGPDVDDAIHNVVTVASIASSRQDRENLNAMRGWEKEFGRFVCNLGILFPVLNSNEFRS